MFKQYYKPENFTKGTTDLLVVIHVMYVTTLHSPTPMYIVGLAYAYMCFVLVVMSEFLFLKNIEILYRTLLLLVCKTAPLDSDDAQTLKA